MKYCFSLWASHWNLPLNCKFNNCLKPSLFINCPFSFVRSLLEIPPNLQDFFECQTTFGTVGGRMCGPPSLVDVTTLFPENWILAPSTMLIRRDCFFFFLSLIIPPSILRKCLHTFFFIKSRPILPWSIKFGQIILDVRLVGPTKTDPLLSIGFLLYFYPLGSAPHGSYSRTSVSLFKPLVT